MSGNAFQWNFDAGRPVAIVHNPHARGLPEWVSNLLDVRTLEEIPGAEYQASDFVRLDRRRTARRVARRISAVDFDTQAVTHA